MEDGVRINKFLSEAGYCSRRQADKLLEEGRIEIDGQIAVMGQKVMPGQIVKADGKLLTKEEEKILLAFNKPKGIVCTSGRYKDNIIDYVNYPKRIYPVGRLDKDSSGLIFLTNQGELVNKLLRASNYHEKEYVVTVNKDITREFLDGMANGVPILDTVTRKCRVKAISKRTFSIVLTQGLNRQIRRMCEYFDYRVRELKRVRIMNVELGNLEEGKYRELSEKETALLLKGLKNSRN
ncbi:MAG: pseudouridine synthase [Eubacterium sp.]|nr:pseudouridine synthase [Eubacterium sp.]